jgi:hypothetical protein
LFFALLSAAAQILLASQSQHDKKPTRYLSQLMESQVFRAFLRVQKQIIVGKLVEGLCLTPNAQPSHNPPMCNNKMATHDAVAHKEIFRNSYGYLHLQWSGRYSGPMFNGRNYTTIISPANFMVLEVDGIVLVTVVKATFLLLSLVNGFGNDNNTLPLTLGRLKV